jgi:hypothetical protein
MFDEVKEYPVCKWCFHSMEFHIKEETDFPRRKKMIKSYC